jgi:putative effector of murein hydrolase LrgA (UPF0299 family)
MLLVVDVVGVAKFLVPVAVAAVEVTTLTAEETSVILATVAAGNLVPHVTVGEV